MAYIAATHVAHPSLRYKQQEVTDAFIAVGEANSREEALIRRIHRSSSVETRHFCKPFEFLTSSTFKERNDVWIENALALGEECVRGVLQSAGASFADISQVIFTSITGLSTPSIDARLMNILPFAPHTKRVPIFGLGCVAGAAGIARAADYLRGHPHDAVLLLSVELCTLTVQATDRSMASVVSNGLFGDGAAAVLLVGARHRLAKAGLPRVIDNQSHLFPDTQDVMGWEITDTGFKVVLNAQVPQIAQERVPPVVDAFLARHDLTRNDIGAWIAHPGGPKVIGGLETGLGLPAGTLDLSRESLRDIGNLSSASVLQILQATLQKQTFSPGDHAVLMAMGPGFCAEVVLLKW